MSWADLFCLDGSDVGCCGWQLETCCYKGGTALLRRGCSPPKESQDLFFVQDPVRDAGYQMRGSKSLRGDG